MTTGRRVPARLLATVSVVVALGVAPGSPGLPRASAAPATGIVLRGSGTASVEVTIPTQWTLPEFHPSAKPHAATYSGTYAGFMIEQAPLTPAHAAKPAPLLGLLFVRGWIASTPTFHGPLPLRWGTVHDGATLDPGRYRFTLFADGPVEVLVAAGGVPRAVYQPRDRVAATVRVLPRLTAVHKNKLKRRTGVIASMPAQPDTIAAWGVFSHIGGRTHEAATCLVRSDRRDRDQLTCRVPPQDSPAPQLEPRDECLWWVQFHFEEEQKSTYTAIGTWRSSDMSAAGHRVSSPHPDVSLQPAAPVGHCSLPKARYDVLLHEALSRSLTRPSSGAAAVFVDPAPMRSLVEDPLG